MISGGKERIRNVINKGVIRLKTLLKPKEKCCKCHYVKNKRGLKKVRGPYGHCSYDMQNCCKDKKTIK